MTSLYEKILSVNKIDYLECWTLYMDLIETKYNPENIDFYNWDLIKDHSDYSLLDLYKKNMYNNMNNIINIVENIIIDITNNTDGYFITCDKIFVDYGLIKCVMCGNIWDGNAQCNCSM
jgi:hypothetical protein